MKTRKIFATLIATVLILMGVVVGKVNANSFSAGLSADKTTIEEGEEVTITLAVSNIDMGADGINTLEGTLVYDNSIFETVTTGNVQSKNNWSTTYNESTGKFLSVMLGGGATENTQIFSITLKSKTSIPTTTGTISVKDITSNDGTDLISAGTKSVNVTVNGTNNATPAPAETTQEQTTSTETPTTTTTTETTATKKVDTKTTAKNSIPKAGIPLLESVLGVSIVAIVAIAGLLLYGIIRVNRK